MEMFNFTDKSKVYLIDDSDNNCNVAINEGMNAILVPENKNATPEYLIEVTQIASISAI